MAHSNLKSTTGHLKHVESSKSKEKRVTFNYVNKPQTVQIPKIKTENRAFIGSSDVAYDKNNTPMIIPATQNKRNEQPLADSIVVEPSSRVLPDY